MGVQPEAVVVDSGRVLVVEDDVDTGRMLCELLRTAGYRVEWVKRGRDALARLADEGHAAQHDVVLLDLMLPDVDGSVIAAHVATLLRRPMVIILSARSAGAAARQPGVLRAFRKPFDVERLLTTMAHAVHPPPAGMQDDELRAICATLRAAPPKLDAFDESSWELARRAVHMAFDRLRAADWAKAPYDVHLAVAAYRAAQVAERSLAGVHIPEGGSAVDCAVGDVHAFVVLQLALSVARWLADAAPAAGVA